MTSRERVLAAIRHEQPDRVPVDFGATRSTGISALAYAKLQKRLGITGPIKVYDVIQQLAEPDDGILDVFGVDVVDLGRVFLTEETDWRPWTLPDGTSCVVPYYVNPQADPAGGWIVQDADSDTIAHMSGSAFYFSQTIRPLADAAPSDYASLLPGCMNKVSWAGIPSPPYY